MRLAHPPQMGTAPSQRLFRPLHSSHANGARFRVACLFGPGSIQASPSEPLGRGRLLEDVSAMSGTGCVMDSSRSGEVPLSVSSVGESLKVPLGEALHPGYWG